MRNNKYLKLDKDVLVEWIYDDDNYLNEDYTIIVDTLNNKRMFTQNPVTGSVASVTNNTTVRQLFNLNELSRKWGVVDTNPASNRYLFMQYVNFPGNVPFKYDIVRIHFPINYTFADKLGFTLSIDLWNKAQTKRFSLSNFYFDKTDPRQSSALKLGTPFSFQEKQWGKYIELQVPSTNALVNDYLVGDFEQLSVRPASIHANLLGDAYDLLSTETPINLSFSFLTKIEKIGTQVAYFATEPFKTALAPKPEYETLAVEVKHSPNGDYFEINGVYNSTSSEFAAFIRKSNLEGKKYVVTYKIVTTEKNLITRSETQVVYEDFARPVFHRPIIQFSTTTATLEVTMQLMNTMDGSVIERRSSYAMLQDEVGKYSNWLTKINTENVSKPKIYNSKPDTITLTAAPTVASTTKTVTVSYPLIAERYNILMKNKSEQVNDTVWYGMGMTEIMLYPFDNVVILAVGKGTNTAGVVPYKVPTGCTVKLCFQGGADKVEVPLYTEGNMVDLGNGILVFKIPQSDNPTLSRLYANGLNQFYVNLKADSGDETSLYAGKFTFYNQ